MTRIAELEARIAALEAKFAARTGAVKVPSGEIKEIVSDLEYWSERLADMRQPQGQSSLKHAASILSALEPAAPEGQQEPFGYVYEHDGMVYDCNNPLVLTKDRQPERMRCEPWTETPLYTHPRKVK